MTLAEIKEFLDEKADQYNRPFFIESDPIQIPRGFSAKEDREISGFLAATLAWGNRMVILRSTRWLLRLMDDQPFHFIRDASDAELSATSRFYHRTFNGEDALYFIRSLRNLYASHGGLEDVFTKGYQEDGTVWSALKLFRLAFLELSAPRHTFRHVPDVVSGSAAKRLNMFLRWMVRSDHRGVDLGLWKGIPSSALMLPLDIHTGNISRKLGILTRKQNDWKAVEEVTGVLRRFDTADPIKYDFALFGLGAFEKF
ncbi:MAG TPA: TIGR02757 family protein [Prolixibacteraceae bacterium]|nr:MAG: hypothetical protein BWX87_01493 [Bacteroidetes bacterium ADurb.Bin123]HOF55762.1 TIGR02757 family protein [Prolixibacteraceae bacterium]HOS00459.1 TIGR02757 family protein [Prolixibacteraceae bacterium]HPL45847.1 TIGR02757 family protein [Prolixibacteraceae bacterium]HPN76585.1 TIGR02757 family protein [Prolixibacteraceae bacterium]